MLFLLLACLLILYSVQDKLVKKYWDKNLTVDVEFTDRHIYEGDSSVLKETIRNDKWLPMPALSVRIAMSRNLQFQNEAKENSSLSDQTYKRDIFSFLFHQQVIRRLSFVAKRRGYYHINEIDVGGSDFFFQSCGHKTVPTDLDLYVFPAQVDTKRISLLCEAISGSMLSRRHINPDPFEFSGIREYQPTDPMNRINYKASARAGKYMVNTFDDTTEAKLLVVMDLEDSKILKYEELIEETLRIASSLVGRLVKARMQVTVLSNVKDSAKPATCCYETSLAAGDARSLALFNEALCKMESRDAVENLSQLLSEVDAAAYTSAIILSKNLTEDNLAAMNALGKRLPLLLVAPYMSETEVPNQAIQGRLIPWEVTL